MMDRRGIAREFDALTTDAGVGRVVSSVLAEVAMIPVDSQQPSVVAEALASARVMDDPDSVMAAPAALARLSVRLEALHEGVDE